MKSILFYLHLHQPKRTGHFRIFDIGQKNDYFDHPKNKEVLNRVIAKSYEPMLEVIAKVISETQGLFKITFSISGILIEELLNHKPEIIKKIKDILDTDNGELIAETFYHSLCSIINLNEFKTQVEEQQNLFYQLFGVKPKVFRNTEFIYNNEIAVFLEKLGYKGVFSEGTEKILGSGSPNYLFLAKKSKNLKVFAKNYKLSDDIAFRFSEKSWPDWPLTSEKYLSWIESSPGEIINLMMDFETFGEHHPLESGIFDFFEKFVFGAIKRGFKFILPSEAIKAIQAREIFNVPFVITWADTERDLSAWLGNDLQKTAFNELYSLRTKVLKSKDKDLIKNWRLLQTSDHFYYMCTKWFNDGDVHKYFNPFDSPYDAYLNYMNILEDLKYRLKL